MSWVLCLLLCIQPVLIPGIFCSASCSDLKFIGVVNKTITVHEDSHVNITFNVTNNCADSNLRDYEITVEKSHDSKKVVCRIRHTDKCQTFGKMCKCPENSSNLYQLTKRVSRKDAGKWTWKIKTLAIKDQFLLDFNITYPPNVTGLNLLIGDEQVDGPVMQGSTVTIVCLGDIGNPPRVHLQHLLAVRHGNLTAEVTSVGVMNHTIPSTQCDDAGTYVCKGQHLNVAQKTLLVKCKPMFSESSTPLQFNVTRGQDLVLDFPVRTHSKVIRSCDIRSAGDISAGRRDPILCRNERLTGTPPDLTLTVTLKRVNTHQGGPHTLTLTNDVGRGHVDFFLNIEGEDSATGWPKTRVLVYVGVSILVVLAVCIALFVVCRVRKTMKALEKRSTKVFRRLENIPVSFTNDLYAGSNVSMMIHNDMFEEDDCMCRAPSAFVLEDIVEGSFGPCALNARCQAPPPLAGEEGEGEEDDGDYAVVDSDGMPGPRQQDQAQCGKVSREQTSRKVENIYEPPEDVRRRTLGRQQHGRRAAGKEGCGCHATKLKLPDEQKGPTDRSNEDDHPLYVPAADVRRNRKRQEHQRMANEKADDDVHMGEKGSPEDEDQMHVPAEEVRMRRKEQRGQASGGHESKEEGEEEEEEEEEEPVYYNQRNRSTQGTQTDDEDGSASDWYVPDARLKKKKREKAQRSQRAHSTSSV